MGRRLQLDARRVRGEFRKQVADSRNTAVFVHRVHDPHETPGARFRGLEHGEERLKQPPGGEREFHWVPVVSKSVFLGEGEIERNGELVDDEENGLGDGVGRRDHIVRVHISTSDPVRK